MQEHQRNVHGAVVVLPKMPRTPNAHYRITDNYNDINKYLKTTYKL